MENMFLPWARMIYWKFIYQTHAMYYLVLSLQALLVQSQNLIILSLVNQFPLQYEYHPFLLPTIKILFVLISIFFSRNPGNSLWTEA